MGERRTVGRVTHRGRTPSPHVSVPPALVELRLVPPPGASVTDQGLDHDAARIRLIACRPVRGPRDRVYRWLDVEAEPEGLGRILHLWQRQYGRRAIAIARLGADRAVVRVTEPTPPACRVAERLGGVCVECPLPAMRRRGPWRLLVPRTSARPNAAARPPRRRVGVSVLGVGPLRPALRLTLRQSRALEVAYELGYFAYPRRGSLGEVARALGVGRSAALQTLRRAMEKLAAGRYGAEVHVRTVP